MGHVQINNRVGSETLEYNKALCCGTTEYLIRTEFTKVEHRVWSCKSAFKCKAANNRHPRRGADSWRRSASTYMMYKCKELTAVMKGQLTHVMTNTENYLLCNMRL